MNKDKFWLEDPSILYANNKYLDLLPTNNMTKIEILNSLSRLFILFFILLVIFNRLDKWLFVPIIGLIFVFILYYGYKKDINIDTFDNNNNNQDTNIESGFYDSDGNLRLGTEFQTHADLKKDLGHSVEDLIEYQKATCRKPTENNPFMNPLLTDFNKEDVPVACNEDDDNIIDTKIDEKFNADFYRDIEDLWNIKNSQRQFYTIPATAIPNDQTEFARWLYNSPISTCKQNSENCLRYTDLRFTRYKR
jgi:hypothetical protein